VLFVRALDAPSPTRLPGTEDAINPFWSPDGRSLGFFAHGKVQRIEVDGGRPQPICEALVFGGGTWGADGTILFGSLFDNIRRVPASGGAPVDVTPHTKDASHRWPFFLPDGRRYLYLDDYDEKSKCAIVLASLDGKETRRLVVADSKSVFSEGRLLYVQSGTLMARRLDPRSGAVGDPVVLGDAVYDNDFGNFLFTASGGVLAFGTEDRASRLQWFDRAGKELGTVGPPADYVHVELSPSEALAMVERREREDDDLFLVDLARDTFSRFTFGGAEFATPVFSPDGARVAYLRLGTANEVFLKPIAGVGAEEKVGSSFFPTSFTPDGRALIGETWSMQTKADVSILRLGKDGGKVEPIIKKRGWENDGRLSPDGKWLAYHSDESGTDEVYVQDFPAGTAKWQISSGGGWSPRWRPDGRELVYVAPAGLFGAEVSPGAAFSVGKSKLVLRVRVKSYKNRCNFAITKDGARFLVNVDPPAPPMTLLLDWTARLER
jgi:Tol biopolymer transport system component